MTSTRARIAAAVAAVALLAFLAPPASANSPDEAVHGQFIGLVPCVITTTESVTGPYTTCVGSTTWVGTWTGVTHYTVYGTYDLFTAAADMTIDETFTGRDDHGRIGTLTFAETLISTPTGIPNTGYVHISARIVDATGDFAGARGHAVFDGVMSGAAGGGGTYSGRWKLP